MIAEWYHPDIDAQHARHEGWREHNGGDHRQQIGVPVHLLAEKRSEFVLDDLRPFPGRVQVLYEARNPVRRLVQTPAVVVIEPAHPFDAEVHHGVALGAM